MLLSARRSCFETWHARMLLLLEFQLARVALQAGRHRERRVELRPARAHPSATGTVRQQRSVELGNDHVIAGLPRLGEQAAEGSENHRVAGADFVVIHPDAIAENEEEAVVVRAARQPAHQPAAALFAAPLPFNRRGIRLALVPATGLRGA